MKDPDEGPESDGNTGFGERGSHDQTLFENIITGAMIAWPDNGAFSQGGCIIGDAFAHHLSINGNPACASDCHAVQAEPNAWLDGSQESFVVQTGFWHAFESNEIIDRAFEDEVAVGLPNFNIGGDSTAPGSEGPISDLQVLDLNKLPLFLFEPFSQRGTEGFDFVRIPVLVRGFNSEVQCLRVKVWG